MEIRGAPQREGYDRVGHGLNAESSVVQALRSLESEIGRAEACSAEVMGRLVSVVNPGIDRPPQACGEPCPGASRMVEGIAELTSRLRSVNDALDRLVYTLEL